MDDESFVVISEIASVLTFTFSDDLSSEKGKELILNPISRNFRQSPPSPYEYYLAIEQVRGKIRFEFGSTLKGA